MLVNGETTKNMPYHVEHTVNTQTSKYLIPVLFNADWLDTICNLIFLRITLNLASPIYGDKYKTLSCLECTLTNTKEHYG